MAKKRIRDRFRPRSKKLLRNLQLFDPFLHPDWRHERVLEMVDRPAATPGRTTRRDDEYVRAARSFILRWRSGETSVRKELLYENPGMYFAYKLHDQRMVDPETAFMIEARLLARQTDEEIVAAIKTLPETINWYEKIFFNVRPFIDYHDWILKQVLLPATSRFAPADAADDDGRTGHEQFPAFVRPYLDGTLKIFSYFGGPILCEFMLSGFKRGLIVRTQDEIGAWLDANWSHSTRMRSAQTAHAFKIDKWNVMELFQTHARIMELQKGDDSSVERRSTIERHVHAMLGEIPWTSGDSDAIFEGTVTGTYDKLSAEMRDEELQLAAAGEELKELEDLPALTIPNLLRQEKETGNAPKSK